jgi:hypothetical protein
MYDWLLTNFSRKNQSIDSIDWLNLLREIEGRHTAIQLDAGRGRFSFLFTTPNLTNNAVERMCRTLAKKKRNEKERKWKKNNKTNLSEEAYLFLNDETFFAYFFLNVTWDNVLVSSHCMWLFFICNENVRMDGTSVTSVKRGDFQAMRILMSVSSKKKQCFFMWGALMDQWMLNVCSFKAVRFCLFVHGYG